MARLAFGLATSLLLALVVYESGVRADAIETPRTADRWIGTWWWVGFGVPLLALGILGGLFLPLGYGVAVLGAILVLLGLLELPHVSEQPASGRGGCCARVEGECGLRIRRDRAAARGQRNCARRRDRRRAVRRCGRPAPVTARSRPVHRARPLGSDDDQL